MLYWIYFTVCTLLIRMSEFRKLPNGYLTDIITDGQKEYDSMKCSECEKIKM